MGWGAGNLGGGAGLNFKVVCGTSAPSSPKENTIWVNTDQKITSWYFSAEEPNVYNIQLTSPGDIHRLLAPHKLSEGDILNFIIPATVIGVREAIRVYDPFTGKEYCVRELNGAAMGAWPSGVAVGVVISNDLYQIGEWVGDGTARLFRWEAFYHDEGTVWITTGTSSPSAFNALKKNSIQVYPVSAKQYVGGAWVEVTAKSYQSGKWVEWRDYIVRGGTAIKDLAILNAAWDSSTADRGNDATITQNNGYVIVKGTKSGYCAAYVQVDITDATRLVVEGEFVSDSSNSGEGKITLAAWSNIGAYVSSNMVASVVLTSTGASLDVSGLTGTMYVGITSVYTNEQKIINLYLE